MDIIKEQSRMRLTNPSSDFWFFGEMQLDLTKSYKQIYDQAFNISEACGYMVTQGSNTLELHGEDCHDSIRIVNVIHFAGGKASYIVKDIYDSKTNRLIKSEPVGVPLLSKEQILTTARHNIAELYKVKNTDEVILKCYQLLRDGFQAGFNSGDQTKRILDLGVKAEDLGIAMCMAISQVPDSLLNDKDKIVKAKAMEINSKVVESSS